MEKKLAEESVLFISVLKWFFLSTLVGITVGLSTVGFLKALYWASDSIGRSPYYYLLLPLALPLSAFLIKYIAPEAEGMGTDKVIEAVHKHSGKIKPAVVPVKLAATILTIATGGSAGKIGPCAQIGGGLTSLLADLFRFSDSDRKKLVICGISAGFSAVFGTPIAGAIFGVEVLFVGSLLYDVLFPSFVAGMISYQVASALGITYFHHPVDFSPVFSESFFLEVLLAGVLFGLCSFLLIEILDYCRNISRRSQGGILRKGFLGGLVLVGLTWVFSDRYLGLGMETIQASLEGREVAWYAFLLKMVFTGITLNFGGSGGIIVPILFTGASSGALLGQILGAHTGTFAALGFVSVLAGATNTPIAASIMALELFGPQIGVYAAPACVISFLMTGHRSVHSTQILAIQKSASLEVQVGKEMHTIKAQFRPREKSLIGLILSLWKKKKGNGQEGGPQK